VVFSHDSQRLASASHDHTVKIWDARTGKCLQTLEGHGSLVTSVVFSHDSQRLASASHDHTVKIWDSKTGKCLQTLEGHGNWVTSVVFSHDSQQLASAAVDGTREQQLSGYSCSSDVSWITWNRENVLWLPTECRFGEVAVSRSTVAIGCRTGRVLVIRFSPTLSPLEMP
jgi:WD40 repeat protein